MSPKIGDKTRIFKPVLAVMRLRVLAGSVTAYDETFHYGLNIIRGDNGGGKSTVADLIFYVLGGTTEDFKPEALSCDTVYAEIEINRQPLTLRRAIEAGGRPGTMLYWGRLDEGLKAGPEMWQLFSPVRSEKQESFSEVLFRQFGIPEVKAESGANLTIYQILRLLYVDQLSALQSLLRDDKNFDTAPMRNAIFDVLIGVYNDQLYSDIYSLRAAERQQGEAKAQSVGIQKFLQQSKIIGDSGELERAQRRLQSDLAEVEAKIQKLSAVAVQSSQKAVALRKVEETRAKVRGRKAEFDNAVSERDRADLELRDSKFFVAELKRRLQDIEEAVAVHTVLGELPLSHCPSCLSVLKPVTTPDCCPLCREPLEKSARHSHIIRMKHDLGQQLRESSALLEEKEIHLQDCHSRAARAQALLEAAQSELNSIVNEARSDRETVVDSLFTEKGRLLSELEHVARQAQIITTLERLSKRLEEINSLVLTLQGRIEKAKRDMASKRATASAAIQDLAILLLASDQVREPAFGRAERVELEPGKNSFALDGRNNFSASSVVYLKNCIHFAIFFASLKLDFFRYPRFILCDNMEDKGMQQERSQNLQRRVAEMSEQSDVLHQIIFTTSMIDPTLNNSKYCVGEFYRPGAWSLKIPPLAPPSVTRSEPTLLS